LKTDEPVAKLVEIVHFAPEALSPIYKKPVDVHQFFGEFGEHKAVSPWRDRFLSSTAAGRRS